MISRKKFLGLSLTLALSFSALMLVKTLLFSPEREVKVKTSAKAEEKSAAEEAAPPQEPEEKAEATEEAEKKAENPGININTAGKAELESLPGIGPALAEAIISHREEKGFFESKEEIMEVSGIAEAKFEAIAELIFTGD